jgi:hypothetical protein
MAQHALHRAHFAMSAGLPAGVFEDLEPGIAQHAGQPEKAVGMELSPPKEV